jgi:hypothetical protein
MDIDSCDPYRNLRNLLPSTTQYNNLGAFHIILLGSNFFHSILSECHACD